MNKVVVKVTIRISLQRIVFGEKKSTAKGSMLYDSINITFLKLEKYINEEQIGDCHQLRRKWGQEGNGCNY